jgi:hypothetical protein
LSLCGEIVASLMRDMATEVLIYVDLDVFSIITLESSQYGAGSGRITKKYMKNTLSCNVQPF